MIDDPIVEEIHHHREQLLRRFGNDPDELVRYLQRKEKESRKPVLPPPARGSQPPGSRTVGR